MVHDECIEIGIRGKKSGHYSKVSGKPQEDYVNEIIYFMFLKDNLDQQGYKNLEQPYQPT